MQIMKAVDKRSARLMEKVRKEGRIPEGNRTVYVKKPGGPIIEKNDDIVTEENKTE